MTARVTGYTSTGPISLTVTDCPKCGVIYAITADYEQRRRSDGAGFHCPNGHVAVYNSDTDAEKLRRAEARETHLRDQLAATAADAERVRSELVRDRHRFANGVCPCCNRYFDAVRRHVESQHPDYDVTKVARRSAVTFACTCGAKFDTWHGLRVHQGKSRTDSWWTQTTSWHGGHLTKVSR